MALVGSRNMSEEELYTAKINTNSKLFYIDLKKNKAGHFLKVSEMVNGKKTFIFIPSEGIQDFIDAFEKINAMILQESED